MRIEWTCGMIAGLLGLGVAVTVPAGAATVISYDAATAGSGVSPDGVSPAWTLSGLTFDWTNNGTALSQDTSAGFADSWTSPKVAGTMVNGSTNYTVEFKVQPISDVGGTPSTDWYARDLVLWQDNVNQYNIIIDKYTTGSSGTGGLRYGTGSYSENLSNLVTGIDWSTPHTIALSYTGSTHNFGVYVDGMLQTTIADSVLKGGSANWAPWQDAITFGSPTTAGGEVKNDWYSFKVTNTAVPEPASLGFMAAAGVLLMRRRTKH